MSKRHRPFRERSCQTDHSCLTTKGQGQGHGGLEISGRLSSSSQHVHSPGGSVGGTPGVHGGSSMGISQYQTSYSSDYSSLESSSLPYANNPEEEQVAILNERLRQYEEVSEKNPLPTHLPLKNRFVVRQILQNDHKQQFS